MAGISSPGLGSGLNVNDLVTQLVAAERKAPQTQIDTQRARLQTQTSAIGALKSLLSTLQSSLSPLADGSAFGKRTAVSSNPDLFTASANTKAVPGNYQIEVLQIAAAQKLASGAFAADAAVGTGTLTLSVGDQSIDLEIGPDNNTLAGIRDAINGARDNPGVSATIVHAQDGDHLVLTSSKTGLDNAFSISTSGGDGGLGALTWDAASGTGNLTQQVAAANASIKIDGFVVESQNNAVDGAIEGVTINVADAEPGQAETLTVGRDTAAMQDLVKTFVSAYNNFVSGAQKLSSYDATSKTAGPLLGDSSLTGIRSQLASVLTSVGGDPDSSLRTLRGIGISLQDDGTLKLDETQLGDALKTQPAQVAGLFGGDAGYGTRLDKLLDGYLGTGGLLDIRSTGLDARGKRLDEQQTRLDSRMQGVQDRYMRQFTALDVTMSQMTQTSNFLTAQLASLASIYKPSDK